MTDINKVTANVERFQKAVKKLSDDIKSVGIDWHDEKHAKLSSLVGAIATSSKNVIATADKLRSHVAQFDMAASS